MKYKLIKSEDFGKTWTDVEDSIKFRSKKEIAEYLAKQNGYIDWRVGNYFVLRNQRNIQYDIVSVNTDLSNYSK